MNREVLSHYDIVTIAETPVIEKDEALKFVHEDRQELSMLYHFEGMGIGYVHDVFKRPDPAGYRLPAFKVLYTDWNHVFAEEGWGTLYLGNHDQPRMLSRWGNDAAEFRVASSKLLITFLLTMRATPITFYKPEAFDVAAQAISPDEVATKIPIYTSMKDLKKQLQGLERLLHPERIILHNVNRLQEGFIEDFGSFFG